MKGKKVIPVVATIALCTILLFVVLHCGHASAFRSKISSFHEATVEVELWKYGQKNPLQVTNPCDLLSALKTASYLKRAAPDVVSPETEVYVITVQTSSQLEKFTIFADKGIGYLSSEQPIMFRCRNLVNFLRNLKKI